MKLSAAQVCILEMRSVSTFNLKWDYHKRITRIAQDRFGGLEHAPMEVKDTWRELMITHETLMDGAQARLF